MRKTLVGVIGSVMLLASPVLGDSFMRGSFATEYQERQERRVSTCAPVQYIPTTFAPVTTSVPVQDCYVHGHEVPVFDPIGDIVHFLGRVIGGTGARIEQGGKRFEEGVRQEYRTQTRRIENERHIDRGKTYGGKIEYHSHPHQHYRPRNF